MNPHNTLQVQDHQGNWHDISMAVSSVMFAPGGGNSAATFTDPEGVSSDAQVRNLLEQLGTYRSEIERLQGQVVRQAQGLQDIRAMIGTLGGLDIDAAAKNKLHDMVNRALHNPL